MESEKELIAVNTQKEPLYKKDEAEYLQKREAWEQDNQEKFSLLLKELGLCQRLVDIGCGWGQFLGVAQDSVPELWGVEESPERLKDIKRACPGARIVICRADRMKLPDCYFDVAVTSQMLHEVKLFAKRSELQKVLSEIHRVLVEEGRYILLDHQDAGEGEVIIKLPTEKMEQLLEFERKYKYYSAAHQSIDNISVRISKRCLQDFLSKYWSLNSPMESMEMKETHNVFEKTETVKLMESSGFLVREWIDFSDIGKDLRKVGGQLLEGEAWFRKFLCISAKVRTESVR